MWVIALIFMLLGTESVYSLEREAAKPVAAVEGTVAPGQRRPPPAISYQLR